MLFRSTLGEVEGGDGEEGVHEVGGCGGEEGDFGAPEVLVVQAVGDGKGCGEGEVVH